MVAREDMSKSQPSKIEESSTEPEGRAGKRKARQSIPLSLFKMMNPEEPAKAEVFI